MKTANGEYLNEFVKKCQFLKLKLTGYAFCFKLRRHDLALTSFVVIASPLQDAANEPRWRKLFAFQSNKEKGRFDQNQKRFRRCA